jgi:drug/metabolite transporter (DMT)-like permease
MLSEKPTRRGTLMGLSAIMSWGVLTVLIRLIGESFGAALGTALYCTIGAGLLWIVRRPKSVRCLPACYLWGAGTLFVVYNVCVGLALGLAKDSNQALEVSLVNYLWPTLMVLFSVLIPPRRRIGWSLVPGTLLAITGIAIVVSGDAGPSLSAIARNVSAHPLPYALALCSGVSWALYSVLTPRLARGYDGTTLFLTGAAGGAWLVYAMVGEQAPGPPSIRDIAVLLAGALMTAAGYVLWSTGLTHGELRLLAPASYATPVLTSGAGIVILGATLSLAFWEGVALVTVGALLSWRATRVRSPEGSS